MLWFKRLKLQLFLWSHLKAASMIEKSASMIEKATISVAKAAIMTIAAFSTMLVAFVEKYLETHNYWCNQKAASMAVKHTIVVISDFAIIIAASRWRGKSCKHSRKRCSLKILNYNFSLTWHDMWVGWLQLLAGTHSSYSGHESWNSTRESCCF